jgi:hypothetical protein
MEHEDHERLGEQLEAEAEKLETGVESLGEETAEVKEDWKRKQSDPAVPGAVPGGEAAGESPDEPAPAEQGPQGPG